MLVLLPPSEGKNAPSGGPPAELGALSHAGALNAVRERVLAAVDPALLEAPAAPAADVYSGVLFAELGLGALPGVARRRADAHVLIASGLWGLVAPSDRIPRYRLPIATAVPGIGRLAAAWRPAVAAALARTDAAGGLVVDCRSGAYATVWRPRQAEHVEVRAFRVHADGSRQAISHMAKASRGRVARAALVARRRPRRPQDVAAAARAAGLDVELTAPGRGAPRRWRLDVLER